MQHTEPIQSVSKKPSDLGPEVVIEVTQTHLRIPSTRQSILGNAEMKPSVKPQIRRLMMA